jgi:hypothetical protein
VVAAERIDVSAAHLVLFGVQRDLRHAEQSVLSLPLPNLLHLTLKRHSGE